MNQFNFQEKCQHLLSVEKLCMELLSTGGITSVCINPHWLSRQALIPAY